MQFETATDLGNQSVGATLTQEMTVGSGSNRLLVVAATGDTDPGEAIAITGATFNGVTMPLMRKHAPGSRWLYVFALANPASGSHNVVITASATVFIGAVAVEYTGVRQTGIPDAFDSKAESTTSDLDLALTVVDESWVILATSGYDGNSAPVAGANTTKRISGGFGNNTALYDSNAAIAAAGATTLHANYTNAVNMNGAIVSFATDTPAAPAVTAKIWIGRL